MHKLPRSKLLKRVFERSPRELFRDEGMGLFIFYVSFHFPAVAEKILAVWAQLLSGMEGGWVRLIWKLLQNVCMLLKWLTCILLEYCKYMFWYLIYLIAEVEFEM